MKVEYKQILSKLGLTFDQTDIVHRLSHMMSKESFSKNVIIITHDTISNSDFWFLPIDKMPDHGIDLIFKTAEKHPDSNFFVITENLNLCRDTDNVKFIYWGPAWLSNPYIDYRDVCPVTEKKPCMSTIWICLNHNRKIHRYITSMYLLGNELERFGKLTLDPTEIQQQESWDTWLYWWKFNEKSEIFEIESHFEVLKLGFNKIKQKQGFIQNLYGNPLLTYATADNFKNSLINLYEQSLVEIINETVWHPNDSGIITEKYLNSIYGKNLPIVIGVKNSIQSIKEIGFDVFEDVIDHSYDSIESPGLRLITALDQNKRLFNDFDYAKKCWEFCQPRMIDNIHRAKSLEQNHANILSNVLQNHADFRILINK